MTHKEIHIGNLIKNKLKEDGRSVSWLARKIHCKRDNIYKIFDRPSIDTAQLIRISLALKTNFPFYLSECYQNMLSKIDNSDQGRRMNIDD
jgi:plasmid maintenance system antidote protein VapI